MTISSVVVVTQKEYAEILCTRINQTPWCSVALRESFEGGEKIIILIETHDLESCIQSYQQLEKLPHIGSIAMVFSYDECTQTPHEQAKMQAIDTLNKDSKAQDMRYYGTIYQDV